MTATPLNTFAIRCDAPNCPNRRHIHSLGVPEARTVVAMEGWTNQGNQDFCPDHS